MTRPRAGKNRSAPTPTPSRPPLLRLGAAGVGIALVVWVLAEVLTLPDPTELAKTAPKTTALMQEREEAARAQGRKVRHRQQWTPLERISPHAVEAVLLSEDASFWVHHGVDWAELGKALKEAWRRKTLGRGASTITQQLAKNLWLSSDRSVLRKLKELALANRLERTLGKRRILTVYLNVAEWGDGVWGIEAGAREHFGVSAQSLSIAQGAVLAAMLPAPRRWKPAAHPPVLYRRGQILLQRLKDSGRISAPEATAARLELALLFGMTRPPEAELPSDAELPGDDVPDADEGAAEEPGLSP